MVDRLARAELAQLAGHLAHGPRDRLELARIEDAFHHFRFVTIEAEETVQPTAESRPGLPASVRSRFEVAPSVA